MLWLLGILGIFASLAIAHGVAYKLASFRDCQPGRAREVMPTLIDEEDPRGDAGQRWRDRVRRAERRLLEHFDGDGDIRAVSATQLAREVGEISVVVEAALERMREEIPCRLQVTRSGELLHDFDAADLDELRKRRRQGLPFRFLVFSLAVMANISALWPVLMVLFVSIITLELLITMPQGQAIVYGFTGILIVGGVMISAWVGSLLIRAFLTPLIPSPPLDYAGSPGRGVGLSRSRKSRLFPMLGARTSSRRSGGGGGGGGGLIQGAFILFFIALVVACLFTIFVWLRGLYRAVSGRDDKRERFGPSAWTRLMDDTDWYERYLPTNDLVSRMVRSIRRALRRRRPGDLQLAGRVVERAKQLGGRVSALDIALHEALDPAEVAEVGAQLCQRFDGEIQIADNGELLFDFDPQILEDTELATGPVYEFLVRDGHQPNQLRRQLDYPGMKLPVNMVGLQYIHIRAADFLVGGSLMMFLTSLYVFNVLDPMQLQGETLAIPPAMASTLWQFGPLITALTLLFATGTVCLATTARYLAKSLAVQGVQRDARRAYAHALRHAIEDQQESLDMSPWINQLRLSFSELDDVFDHEFFYAEYVGLLMDFELDEGIEFDDAGAMKPLSLAPLKERMEVARHGRSTDLENMPTHGEPQFPDIDREREDEVVFDSKITPEKVRALG